MNNSLDLQDLYSLLLDHFGNKIENITIDSQNQDIDCILYNSFVFSCGIEKPRNNFKGGIILSPEHVVTSFFGKRLSLNNEFISIRKNFEIVDNYCRLRLTDKFLDAYDKAYKSN